MDKKKSPPSIKTLTWGLNAFMAVGDAFSNTTSSSELMKDVCEAITKQEAYVLAWIGFSSNDAEKLVQVKGVGGVSSGYLEGISVSWSDSTSSGNGPIGRAIRTGKPWLISDTNTDPNFEPWKERAQKYDIHSVLAVPIKQSNKVIGALAIYSSVTHSFTELEVHIFSNMAAELGFGFASFQRQEELTRQYFAKEMQEEKLRTSLTSTVEVMSKTMELRDPYTAGHQKNVATISCLIANKLGWSPDLIYGLRLAAMIHDIGKIAIPSEILTKPSKLSEFEGKLLQEHPENGYQLLKDIDFPWPIAEIVRQHHERIDGSGYPRGLKGDQILPEAQVLAVADTIEAMYSHRPYGPGLGLPSAIQVIKDGAGKTFNLEIANVAIELFEGRESPL